MLKITIVALIILALAVLMTMTGRGGGNFYVPALVASGQSMHQAATTGQFILLLTACAGMLVFQKHRLVDWKLALVIDPPTDIMALAGGYLAHMLNAPDFAAPTLDPQLNDYWARALVTGDWTPPEEADDPEIRSTPYGRPPGYPYVLALVYRLSGGSYLAPRVVQMALGLVNVLLLFMLGRAVFGRAVGLIAAALMAVYWAFIYFEGELNSPVFVVFLALLLLHVMRLWRKDGGAGWALAAGVVLGLLALMRPNALLVGGAVVLWFGWVAVRRRHGIHESSSL